MCSASSINLNLTASLPSNKAYLWHNTSLPTHADHTGGHQLLDLDAHRGVLHVLLQSGGVALGLVEDALHDGVVEDGHDLDLHISINFHNHGSNSRKSRVSNIPQDHSEYAPSSAAQSHQHEH